MGSKKNRGSMDPVYERGSMDQVHILTDLVHGGGSCFVLSPLILGLLKEFMMFQLTNASILLESTNCFTVDLITCI